MPARLDRLLTPLTAVALAGLNVVLVWPLFRGGYTPYLGSIESTYITASRLIAEHWLTLGWVRLWYLGFPFHLLYPPALLTIVAGLQWLSGTSVASAYRLATAGFYVATPATLYLFVRGLSGRHFPAVVAALTYSLAPSFANLIPAVRADASGFGFAPWQLNVLLRFGEGPHTAALALMPLAALAFWHALRRHTGGSAVLASLAVSAVALTNWIGLFGLTVALGVLLFSELLRGAQREKLKAAAIVLGLTYGLCAFWFNLSFMRTSLAFGAEGGRVSAVPGSGPALLMIGLTLAFLAISLFSRSFDRQAGLVAGGWLLVLAFIVVASYVWGISLAPQPRRFMAELNMGAAMCLGLLADWGRRQLSQVSVPLGRLWPTLYPIALLFLLGLVSLRFLRSAHAITSPNRDITATSEYQVARWLADRLSAEERVYATGSHAFWLNVFSDVPQIRGGHDVIKVNPWWPHVSYQINTGQSGPLAVLWARAWGIRYLIVSYPGAADVYQDYAHPGRFEGLLPKVYDQRGMVIFEVPLDSQGFVRQIDFPAYERLPPIRDVLDEEGLRRYVALVDAAPRVADYRWAGGNRLEFEVDLADADQALLIRMAYHPGWQAFCDGRRVASAQDRVGLWIITPGRAGPCHMVLQFGPLWDQWLGYGITALTWLALLVAAVRGRLLSFASRL